MLLDYFLAFGSRSESLDSFQKCFLDICVIVSVKQEFAISMKILNPVLPCCFFVVLYLNNVFWCNKVSLQEEGIFVRECWQGIAIKTMSNWGLIFKLSSSQTSYFHEAGIAS